jgi:hypothetical protein
LFAEKSFRLSEKMRLELRAEVFNVFNHRNILAGRNANYNTNAFGTPAATNFGGANAGIANVDPSRELQFQVRFRF